MAIALDASTPAFSQSGGGTNYSTKHTSGPFTQTSASFTPPAASLVILLVLASAPGTVFSALGVTAADSASNSYTLSPASQIASNSAAAGGAGIFTCYYSSSPGAVTVAATLASAETASGGSGLDICPLVLTGAASNQSGAGYATEIMSSSSVNQEISVTTTTAGSWVVLAGVNWTGGSGFATADGQTTTAGSGGVDGNGAGTAFGYSKNATGTPGATTFGWTQAGTDKATMAALEILPATAALSVTTSSLPDAAIGSAYSQNLAATGGTPPYVWEIASGSLPPGLVLS